MSARPTCCGSACPHNQSSPFLDLSHLAVAARLRGMNGNGILRFWVTAVVAAHLIISIVHGTAHTGGHVPLSRAGNVFVLIVIIAGPLAGLALMWRAGRIGAWIV